MLALGKKRTSAAQAEVCAETAHPTPSACRQKSRQADYQKFEFPILA